MKNSRILMCLIMFGMLLAVPLMAQTTSGVVGQNPYSISGFVFDSDGNKAVGAVLTLTVDRTGEELIKVTNSNGSFALQLLNLGQFYQDGDKLIVEVEYTRYPDADNESAILITEVDIAKHGDGEVVEFTTEFPVEAPSIFENMWFWVVIVVLVVIVIALFIMASRK